MAVHEWRLDRVGEHFVLVHQTDDATENYPLTDSNVMRLCTDAHKALYGFVFNARVAPTSGRSRLA